MPGPRSAITTRVAVIPDSMETSSPLAGPPYRSAFSRGVLEHCSFEKGILEKNWHAGPGMTQLNCPLHLMCGGKNIAATAIGPLAPVQSHLQDLANYILRFNTHALR